MLEAVEVLKKSLSAEDFEVAKKSLGFHGNSSLFRELNFDPFLQTACEPYHLLFLGILRFFFRLICWLLFFFPPTSSIHFLPSLSPGIGAS